MSQLIYNGIEIAYIRTQSVDFSPKYDDTGVDYVWTEVNISVEGVVNGGLVPALQGESPTNTIVRIRGLLEAPRKRLQFIVGSDTMIDVGGAGRDVGSGPLPDPLTITQIGGSTTFLVSYKIKTFISECPAGSAPPDYQSHRWKETVKIDENFYTRKTRTGKVYTRSDINANADALRGLVIPPTDNGFKVMSIEIALQEDGLALMYTWEEQEVFLQPPAPSTKAEGEYSESTNTPGGAVRYAECRVRLEGAKTSDKGALLAQAILICVSAVSPDKPLASGNNGGDAMLKSAAVKTSLYENKVEVNIKALITSSTDRKNSVPMNLKRFSFAPKGSEPGTLPPDPGIRGTAGLKLIANALADPCLQEAVLVTGGLGENRALRTTGLPEVRVLSTTLLPDDNRALYSTTLDQLPGFYTYCKIRNTYAVKTWNAQLPVASPGSACAIVTLASPTGKKIVEWSLEKVGTAPKIPDPNVNDSNLVLLDYSFGPEMEMRDGDGTMLTFPRSGRYVYAVQDITQLPVDAGAPPFLDPSQVRSLRTIQLSDLIHGIIDDAPGDHVLTTQGGQTFPVQRQ